MDAGADIADLLARGLEPGYRGDDGGWHAAPPSTIDAIRAALGSGRNDRPGLDAEDPVRVVRRGDAVPLAGAWEIRLEDGAAVVGEGELPSSLPLGYHQLRRPPGRLTRLIVTPWRCRLPSRRHRWGWAVQLPALRSTRSWGIGDLADLRSLAESSAGLGASTALVSPLHASRPGLPQQPSPYFPSSRRWRNPLYLRVEEVPGAGEAGSEGLGRIAAEARALNADRRIDRDQVWALKLAALERLWDRFGGDTDFDQYCDAEGPALSRYAAFCVLSELHRGTWHRWPPEVRHPESSGVDAFVSQHRDRVRFHQWLQWLLDRQVSSVGAQVDLVQDLAVGVDPSGADAWMWQDLLAPGVSVGAPPDAFNRFGQSWGLAPFDPWKLRADGYEPFAATVRANLRHAGGLRVDHVMGLSRLFWVPAGADPGDGAYVRYPSADLLGVLALESERAGAFVVGEDLGTVEPSLRDELARRNVLSYRVLWFEEGEPAAGPVRSVASISTHDLPTVAGIWTRGDVATQRRLGLDPDGARAEAIRSRLKSQLALDEDAPLEQVIVDVHRLLARAPSLIVLASLEDALGVVERPNMPGTTDAWPNWSLALPLSLEAALSDSRVVAVAETLRSRETIS